MDSIFAHTLKRWIATLGGVLVLGMSSPLVVHAQIQGTGAFRHLAEIETSLKRGVSSKADVQNLLGVPNGSGGSQFAALGATPQQVWYYEDVETTGAEAVGSVMRMKMRMQFVIIFFKGDVFDGYLWTTQISGDVHAR